MSDIQHIVLGGTDIYVTEIRVSDGDTRRARELAAVTRLLDVAVPQGDTLLHREDGAPYLEKHPELHVSVSHSLRFAVLSVAAYPHGIDIEALRPRLRDVARRFINPNDAIDTDTLTNLLLAWTAKEAVFKAASSLYKGLMLSDISLTSDTEAAIPAKGPETFTLFTKEFGDDNLLTLALPVV